MDAEPRFIPEPGRNRLLDRMSSRLAVDFRKRIVPVELRLGEVLHHAGMEQQYVYFPTVGAVSVLYLMRNGSSAEIGLIGKDGLVGIAGVLGGTQATTRAMVQVPGYAIRASTLDVQKLLAADAAFRGVLQRYLQIVLTQATQTAVCNRYHTTTQQLCRWILHSIDLSGTDAITMTQQQMAERLGVRREGVSVVAAGLRAGGLIDYARGHVLVLDRKGLETRACECYAVVAAEMQRLLPERVKARRGGR